MDGRANACSHARKPPVMEDLGARRGTHHLDGLLNLWVIKATANQTLGGVEGVDRVGNSLQNEKCEWERENTT